MVGGAGFREGEERMLNVLKSRIGSAELESRLTQLTTALSGLALLPMAVIALERNSANRVEFAIGFGLALVLALHLLMLGMLVSRVNRLETHCGRVGPSSAAASRAWAF